MNRRVVVTGVGVVSPLGTGGRNGMFWENLLVGNSGLKDVKDVKTPIWNGALSECPISLVGQIDRQDPLLNPTGMSSKKSAHPDFVEFALLAAKFALDDSKLLNMSSGNKNERFGVAIGNGGIGSLQEIISSYRNREISYKKLSPFFVPRTLINMAAGNVSIKFGLQGPNHSVATACAAGTHSVGDAFNFIRLGMADAMLAGGTDFSIDDLAIAGFARMKALSPAAVVQSSTAAAATEGVIEDLNRSEREKGSRSQPFDIERNGFVISEGAGLLVLEDLAIVKASGRESRILCEVVGYGLSGDASHITAPSPDGDGARRSMQMAMMDAGVSASDIGYINAHATSTPMGDRVEIAAINELFKERLNTNASNKGPLFISSTKGATGHLLGAAGAVELIFTALALKTGRIPLTFNLKNLDPTCAPLEIDGHPIFRHVVGRSVEAPNLTLALKNSFGFGGTNASIVMKKYDD